MNLQEIFNTKWPVDWRLDADDSAIEIGTFEYEHEKFNIKIVHDVINGLHVAAVSFSVLNEDGSFSTLLTGHHQSYQIIGCVVNALLAKQLHTTEDAVVFSARGNVEARVRVYNRIVDRLMGVYFSAKFSVPLEPGKATVLITNEGAKKPALSTSELTALAAKSEA